MALYYYKKAPIKPLKHSARRKKGKQQPSVATILDNLFRNIDKKLNSTKPVSFIVPIVLIVSGIGILFQQIKPYAIHFIQSKFSDRLNQEIITLVPESYEEIRAAYISDPGVQYFSTLLERDTKRKEVSNFTGKFYLTIEKIKIFDAPVTANVDSSDGEVYQRALSGGLAHFRGTRIPGEDGNVLIYGHSAAGDYAEKHQQDVVTAFTRLFKLNIGDEITIRIEDKELTYTVKKIKEVNPEAVDILYNGGSGKTLTLMTCSPPGLNANRLIVVAIQQQ